MLFKTQRIKGKINIGVLAINNKYLLYCVITAEIKMNICQLFCQILSFNLLLAEVELKSFLYCKISL